MVTLLVLTSGKEPYKSRSRAISETWGSDFDKCFFFSDISGKDTLQASMKKNHGSAEEKAVYALEYAKNIDSDWFLMVDDDTYVQVEKLKSLVGKADSKKVYGQIINCWTEDKTLMYPSGGAGILMSKELVDTIKIKKRSKFSDVTIGLNIPEDFTLENHMGFNGIKKDLAEDVITIHRITADEHVRYYAADYKMLNTL